ncbi:acyltransferase family protein [uncultured Akkermansia sp.]|uniref:acyltransferase family protein n=1 Tax=uncultured Akkermansia sp. TaxID=512294 RepID=UPI0025EC1D6F|nr:acyltransferase family protein [uncultured Akkermansia sp.]
MSTNQPLNSHGSHIAWVDFLRILACFLVVLAHCCDPFVGSFDGTFNFKSAVFWGSFVRPCVPLFAMISGVLLFPVTMEMGAFYARRLKRVLM